jgi:hypothetical protein
MERKRPDNGWANTFATPELMATGTTSVTHELTEVVSSFVRPSCETLERRALSGCFRSIREIVVPNGIDACQVESARDARSSVTSNRRAQGF